MYINRGTMLQNNNEGGLGQWILNALFITFRINWLRNSQYIKIRFFIYHKHNNFEGVRHLIFPQMWMLPPKASLLTRSIFINRFYFIIKWFIKTIWVPIILWYGIAYTYHTSTYLYFTSWIRWLIFISFKPFVWN